ncbi:MAG: 30S ribosomal protein S6 [Clostridia bacterium]
MNNYQLLYIINNEIAEEAKNEIVDKFVGVIESLSGTVETVDKWGAKKFAYPIQRMKQGYYVLIKFSAGPDVPAEIDRQMKNNDKILRQLITRI